MPQVGDGVFEVLSTSGDTHLGGDDFDKRIVDFLAGDFKNAEGVDIAPFYTHNWGPVVCCPWYWVQFGVHCI